MRAMGFATLTMFTAVLLAAGTVAWSQTDFSPAELDELLAPIALYPDPLLAQILPAATYPDQLAQASNLVASRGASAVDAQPWDVSVRAVAHYPSVLSMMVGSPDWTTAVGQAYVNQPEDVMKSIQRLRGKARLMGYLSSNSYQTVAVSNGYISIAPARAQYVYVPTYNPGYVYTNRRTSYTSNIIAFGAGLLIGAWLNNAIDWNHNRVYYHGWNGGGWVGRSRPFVQSNNRYYNRPFTVNRNITRRSIPGYRQDLQRGIGTYRPPGLVTPRVTAPVAKPVAPRVRPAPKPGVSPRAPVTRPAPKPGVSPRAPVTRPAAKPGAVVPRRPGAGPGAPTVRPTPTPFPAPRPPMPAPKPTPRPRATVTPSAPRAVPSAPGVTRPTPRFTPPAARPATKPNAGVTRPKPSVQQSAPTARPAPRVARPNVKQPAPAARPAPGVARPSSRPSAPAARTAPPKAGGQKKTRGAPEHK